VKYYVCNEVGRIREVEALALFIITSAPSSY
jgi:hypothetical protein